MQLTLKRERFIDIYGLLDAISGMKKMPTKQMSFMIKMNRPILQRLIDTMKETSRSEIPEYLEYEKKVENLTRDSAIQLPDGSPAMNGGKYIIASEKQKSFEDARSKLDEKYKDAVSKREKEFAEFQSTFMQEEMEMDLTPISFKYIPDYLRENEIDILMPLISESPEQIAEMLSQ